MGRVRLTKRSLDHSGRADEDEGAAYGPLSGPAIRLLKRLWKYRHDDIDLIFSVTGEKPISDMTMTKVLRYMNIVNVTVRGFRSSFTDWAAEQTDFPKEIVDKALAHKIPNQVEAAYRRTDFLGKRRQLMEQWADYLTKCTATTAVAAAIREEIISQRRARLGAIASSTK